MTSETGGSRSESTLHDRIDVLLRGPGPLDKRTLLAALDAEIEAREFRAYTAGWNDALAELRRR
ncbi:hypothetical protein [Streptomyces sp. NPDC004267]|uniref:hypothetical protein n=1 Tax=Streptomyces sp. NPDC004267 TaxID=3364694 RepID=UPI0036CF4BF9